MQVFSISLLVASMTTLLADGLESTIPFKQAALSKTWQPPESERSPAGTGKFILFTRDYVGKEKEWDFIARAWECIPSEPEKPITKRVDFCHSSWNATPLLHFCMQDGSFGKHQRFVHLQVDAPNQTFRTNLYDIDYRTWEIRCLWQGDWLTAFCVHQDSILCKSDDKWLSLNTKDGKISHSVPFIPNDVSDALWLVRKVEQPAEDKHFWSYNPSSEKFLGRFIELDTIQALDWHRELSPNGLSCAWMMVGAPESPNWRGGVVKGTLVLQRHGHSEDVRATVEMEASAGFGRPVIPHGIKLRFAGNEAAEFSARFGDEEKVWTIGCSDGRLQQSQRPSAPQASTLPTTFDGVPVVEYLRSAIDEYAGFGRAGLAPAFLVHSGLLKSKPQPADCSAGVSPDGKHILFVDRKGPLRGQVVYGNLVTKKIIQWKCPSELQAGTAMSILWVEVP